MIPESYFPLESETFALRMGIRPIPPGTPLIDIDDGRYLAELRTRRAQLQTSPGEYDVLPPSSLAAQCEAADLLLTDLQQHHADNFSIARDGRTIHVSNRRLAGGFAVHLDPMAEQAPPLLTLALHVQEDLCLLDASLPGAPLVAGVVTFPGDWSIRDKAGLSFVNVHGPVPGFDPVVAQPSLRLLEALKEGKPVWRPNWGGLKPTDQLDLSPKHAPMVEAQLDMINPGNVGTRMYFRVERQTLTLLPVTRHVLFTIHTYLATLADVARNPAWARYVLGWLRTAPAEWIAYKGMRATRELLMAYLESRQISAR